MITPGNDESIKNTGAYTVADMENLLDNNQSNWRELGEVGYTGTKIYNGYIDTEEWVGSLKGVQLFATIDKMRTDAVIAAIERGFFLPIKQANYHIDYDDPAADQDLKNNEILDELKKQFANINMPSFLHNACLSIPYGFSMFEICYDKNIKTGLIDITKLAPRLPKTIWRWLVDGHGNLNMIEQLVYAFEPPSVPGGHSTTGAWKYVPIPAEKLLLITHQKEGGDFQGKSEYRPFYREWLTKDATFKQLAIAVQRLGGGVPVALMENDATDTAYDKTLGVSTTNIGAIQQVENVLRNLQSKESSYAVMKFVKELKNLTLEPNAMKGLIDLMLYCDQSIAKSAFQMFMSLGQSETGSRAVGSTFEGLYYEALYGYSEEMCSPVNEQLIKRWIDMNYGEREVYPKLHLEFKQDMSAIAETLSVLKKDGLIDGNSDLENYFLAYYGLPTTNNTNRMKTQAPAPLFSDKCNCVNDHAEIKFSEIKMNRKENERESKIINFAETADELNTLKKSLADELRKAIEPKMLSVAKQLADGAKIYSIDTAWGNKVTDIFKKYYKKIQAIGTDHVKKELVRQNKQLSERVMFAEPKKTKKINYDKWVDKQSEINSYQLENDVKTAIGKYYATAQSQGLEGAALKQFIMDSIISEVGARYDKAAGNVTGAYGMVRDLSEEDFKDVIKSKVRAEVFDNNLCKYCEEQDGTEYALADDGEYYSADGLPAPELPDPECLGELGGNRCRGIWLYYTD